jgi:hypothetical protein
MDDRQRPALWLRILVALFFIGLQIAIVGAFLWVMFTYVITPPDFSAMRDDFVKFGESIRQGYDEFMALPFDVRVPMILGGLSTALFELSMFLYVRRRIRDGLRWRALLRLAAYSALGFLGMLATLRIPEQPHTVPLLVFLMTCSVILFQANLMMFIYEALNGIFIWIGLRRAPEVKREE